MFTSSTENPSNTWFKHILIPNYFQDKCADQVFNNYDFFDVDEIPIVSN